jgi:sensor histidine kinase regulating citrate/malate metabolism/HPt (histidine-containing phosphotransfer) domain-containing protein
MKRPTLAAHRQWLSVAATVVITALLTALLAYGMQRATQLQSASAALQVASELSSQPQLLRSELTLLQRGLESVSFVGDSLAAVNDGRTRGNAALANLQASLNAAGMGADARIAPVLNEVNLSWQRLQLQLAPLAGVDAAGLYADSASGSVLTAQGQKLQVDVNNFLTRQSATTQQLTTRLGALATALRDNVVQAGSRLRLLLLAGTVLAAALLAMIVYFALRARTASSTATKALGQVQNILGTVREGLFLVDREGIIGAAHSASLAALLHHPNPAGNVFTELLRPMVDDKTVVAAGKYISLMWKQRVNDELIDSVNPLHQVAVTFQRPQGGGSEVRYLSFAFRRARDSGDYVLGVVADVTERMLLQQELEQLKSQSGTSGELVMQLLKSDPAHLKGFLQTADQALQKCNELLAGRGSDQSALRTKLDGVFRELHSVKGEAAALGLESLASQIHAAEDLLTGLRERGNIAGNDFVPIVTHLDELLRQVATLSETRERVAAFSIAAAPQVARNLAAMTGSYQSLSDTQLNSHPGRRIDMLLQSLAAEVSQSNQRRVQLSVDGMDAVPESLYRIVKDISVQMVRNAIVHGVESADKRNAAGKPPVGSVRISFSESSQSEYSLMFEDDGRGLSYEQILDRALQLGLIKPEQATSMDRAAAFRLIFAPGFSTAAGVTGHAGRGVGLDAVNALVRERGGRIGIATAPGHFTRFRVTLPRPEVMQQSASA